MAFPENTVNDTGIKHIWDKVTAALSGKVDKVSGKGLSTNDYTTAEKDKLAGIESGAQVNTVTSVAGKTGEVTLAKGDVGLGNVDNTSDANKPISTATQNALNNKADNSDVTETDTSNSTPFLYRETPYEADRVFLDELVGGSIAWNQLVQNGNFESTSGWSSYISTFSVSNNEAVVTSGGNIYIDPNYRPECIAGHKYFVSCFAKKETANTNRIIGITTGGDEVYLDAKNDTNYNHYALICTADANNTININLYAYGSVVHFKDVVCIDLTQMFGTTIADYIYSLEQATAGSGIAWLKSHGFFTEDYYPYNAGELISVKTSGKKYVGFNQLDEELELGNIDSSTGQNEEISSGTHWRSKNYIPVKPNESYYKKLSDGYTTNNSNTTLYYYDKNKNYLFGESNRGNLVTAMPSGCYYVRVVEYFVTERLTPPQKICLNVDTPTGTPKNGDYVPYEEHTYDISNIDLRGIPKLVNNELVYDGDIYESNGNVTRKYGIVDLGSLEWNMPVSGGFSAQLTLSKSGICSLLCSVYGYDDSVSFAWNKFDTLSDKTIFRNNSQTIIYCKDTTYTDATAFKTAVIGQQLVYELATPFTENATHYQNPQICDKNGTEEFIDDRTVPVPVGHNSTYANLPSMMDGDFLNYMVKNFASEEYVDSAVERVAPKATLINTWMISEESDTISVDLSSYDCNFFLLEYLFQSKRGTTLIPRPQGGSFSASVVTYNNGTPYYIELDYNPTTKELAYTSNVTSQFGILAIYTI